MEQTEVFKKSEQLASSKGYLVSKRLYELDKFQSKFNLEGVTITCDFPPSGKGLSQTDYHYTCKYLHSTITRENGKPKDMQKFLRTFCATVNRGNLSLGQAESLYLECFDEDEYERQALLLKSGLKKCILQLAKFQYPQKTILEYARELIQWELPNVNRSEEVQCSIDRMITLVDIVYTHKSEEVKDSLKFAKLMSSLPKPLRQSLEMQAMEQDLETPELPITFDEIRWKAVEELCKEDSVSVEIFQSEVATDLSDNCQNSDVSQWSQICQSSSLDDTQRKKKLCQENSERVETFQSEVIADLSDNRQYSEIPQCPQICQSSSLDDSQKKKKEKWIPIRPSHKLFRKAQASLPKSLLSRSGPDERWPRWTQTQDGLIPHEPLVSLPIDTVLFLGTKSGNSFFLNEKVKQHFQDRCATCGLQGHSATCHWCPLYSERQVWSLCDRCNTGCHRSSLCPFPSYLIQLQTEHFSRKGNPWIKTLYFVCLVKQLDLQEQLVSYTPWMSRNNSC